MKVYSGDKKCRSEMAIVVLAKRGSTLKKSGKQCCEKVLFQRLAMHSALRHWPVNCSEKPTARKHL